MQTHHFMVNDRILYNKHLFGYYDFIADAVQTKDFDREKKTELICNLKTYGMS